MSNEYPKLSPKLHAENHRLLCRESWVRDSLYEIVLLEWSKGGRAKVKHLSGSISWLAGDDLPEVVEDLGNINTLKVVNRK